MTEDSAPRRASARIEDHGIIGNLATVALISTQGAIDFACFPSFDSPTIFAELLDPERGGVFSIGPDCETLRSKQMYLPDSNVLMTRFYTEGGVGEITDFMPLTRKGAPAFRIVRQIRAVTGEMRFVVRCAPRFDYGRAAHSLELSNGTARFLPEHGGPGLRLKVNHPLSPSGADVTARMVLHVGEILDIVLEADSNEGREDTSADHGFAATVSFWRTWAERSTYRGRWREIVMRAALTLKLLMSQEHGSLVAAATFALPEVLGGERNWDYRYTWIRDAAYSVYAFMALGYVEEASAFVDWVQARCTAMRKDGSMQIMYGIDGRTDLQAKELTHWRGHCDSRPVTIGNDAYQQLQLDIYGALLDSIYTVNENGAKTSIDA